MRLLPKIFVLAAFALLYPGQAAETVHFDLASLCSGQPKRGALVQTEGTVVDAFDDEIDKKNAFLLVKDAEFLLPAAIPVSFLPDARSLLDSRVSVRGTYYPTLGYDGSRRFSGPFVRCESTNDVRVLQKAPGGPFDVPVLERLSLVNPQHIARLGRRKVSGTVLAAWGDHSFLVRLDDRRMIRVETTAQASQPAPGASIAAAGYPSTDQFRLKLRRAVWKRLSDEPRPLESPEDVPPRLLITKNGAADVSVRYYGRTIRLSGIVRAVPAADDDHGRLYVEADGYVVAIDRGTVRTAFTGLERGCTVSVKGVCLVEANDWQPYDVFPRLGEFTLVLRTGDDIAVTSSPPWWNTGRLLTLAIVLLTALVAILIWNAALKRLVAKRSRQLVREEVVAAKAELRTTERTNLAIELHDALSQNLTGIALEMKTAARTAAQDLPSALRHLELAQRSLNSCREELRTCLWDLRTDVSGRDSLDDAIRTALKPLTDETVLTVRCDVPRPLFSEIAVSALLRIIRELVTNAIRHGHATAVRVEGRMEGPSAHFSVSDDGAGFDPAHAPGLADGHFGLQGVRERLAKFHGDLQIDSTPGSGTCVRIHLDLPTEKEVQ